MTKATDEASALEALATKCVAQVAAVRYNQRAVREPLALLAEKGLA